MPPPVVLIIVAYTSNTVGWYTWVNKLPLMFDLNDITFYTKTEQDSIFFDFYETNGCFIDGTEPTQSCFFNTALIDQQQACWCDGCSGIALLYSIAISANLSGSVLNLSQAYNRNCFCFINSFTNFLLTFIHNFYSFLCNNNYFWTWLGVSIVWSVAMVLLMTKRCQNCCFCETMIAHDYVLMVIHSQIAHYWELNCIAITKKRPKPCGLIKLSFLQGNCHWGVWTFINIMYKQRVPVCYAIEANQAINIHCLLFFCLFLILQHSNALKAVMIIRTKWRKCLSTCISKNSERSV